MSSGQRSETISVLHVGKYFPPFRGGMESFMEGCLRTLGTRDIRLSAIVHDHRTGFHGGRTQWPVHRQRSGKPASVNEGSVPLYRVPVLGRFLYTPFSPTFPYWLRSAIVNERPDILHFHLPNASAFWAFMIPEARRVPWIIHWQSDVVSSNVDRRLKMAYPLYRPFEQRMLRNADKVIVTSPPYLEGSAALAPWREKCRVIPLGLDPSGFGVTAADDRDWAEEKWGRSSFRVLSVGRLTYYKGHEYLIRAFESLPGARLMIVGEGGRRKHLEETIADGGLQERVEMLGGVEQGRLHALMETCDCFCLPSIERTESFGMVLIEAMAHAKPTVVCDVPQSGVTWVVLDGETGLVVPPAKPAALTEALNALARDPDKRRSMGLAGERRVQENFHIDQVCNEISRMYFGIFGRGALS